GWDAGAFLLETSEDSTWPQCPAPVCLSRRGGHFSLLSPQRPRDRRDAAEVGAEACTKPWLGQDWKL
ncbi:unnamed protein product, partial [Effrenium voratum]